MVKGLTGKQIYLGVLVLALILVIACGSAAEPTTAPSTSDTQPATAVPSTGDTPSDTAAPPTSAPAPRGTSTPVPTAAPIATAVPATGGKATGTLRIALDEVGPPRWTPNTQGAPQNSINNTTFGESIWQKGPDGSLQGVLLESWKISDDGTVWTLKFREGIPFHHGYGEFTAADFAWTMKNSVEEGTTESQSENYKRHFFAEGGGIEFVDDYTINVDTVTPAVDFTWQLTMAAATQMGKTIFSQAYFDDIGAEKASVTQAVGTGPWRSISHETGGIWKFEAVEDHWRKSPNFAFLEYSQISEESTRLANFLTGKLDTAKFNTESVALLEKECTGCKFMTSIGGQLFINIHGQMYIDRENLGTPRNGDLPWISASADINSPEWEQAKKVRLAMNHAIDRDLLVETLLRGRGAPAHVYGWLGLEPRMGDLADLKYEYDPELSIRLLEEAGYPDGFEINFALTNRPYPGTMETAEAVSTMWEEVGIRSQLSRMPMSAFRPNFLDRSWEGVNSHGRSPDPEPGPAFNSFRSTSAVNYGLEHPIIEELFAQTISTVDDEERFEVSRKISRFIFENAITIPTVSVFQVWPVGPNIDTWEMICCVTRVPSNLEFIPHRSN